MSARITPDEPDDVSMSILNEQTGEVTRPPTHEDASRALSDILGEDIQVRPASDED